MSSQWGTLLTIIEDTGVTQTVQQECGIRPRFAEAWDALLWLLARSAATIGIPSKRGDPRLRLYVQAGDELADLPSIWVVFAVNPESVEIIAINIVAFVESADD